MENFILLKMFIQNILLEKLLINLLISVVIFKYLSCFFFDENLKWETFQEQTLCCTIIVFLSALLMSVAQ